MTIRQLRLCNYGPYAGAQELDLTPSAEGAYDRPLVLVTGKNGVGKSTIMEAVRLCLHGSLALGRSVSRQEYQSYLEARIHRPASSSAGPDFAGVTLAFDHVTLGRRRHYEVTRSWSRKTAGAAETLEVVEDNERLTGLTEEQKEALLRGLVPPCATDLFLLDNEKLNTLSSESASSALLSELVESLLGLDLVQRLQRDLDVYLTRTSQGGGDHLRGEFEAALCDEERLGQAVEATQVQLRSTNAEIQKLRGVIAAQEHRIAEEGHGFAERLGQLRAKKDMLGNDIAKQRAAIEETAAGLVPFAISPKFCQLVIERLEREEQEQRADVARELIDRASEFLSSEFGNPALWKGVVIPPEETAWLEMADRMRDALAQTLGCAGPDSSGLLLHASSQDRALLTSWALDSQNGVPEQFCQAVGTLRDMERDLAATESQLAQIPSHEALAPLIQDLNNVHQQLGSLLAKEHALEEQHRRQAFEHLQATRRVRDVRQKVQDAGKARRAVELAGKTQTTLGEYKSELLDHKLRLLERAIAERFNLLCRKPAFLTQVSIARDTFALTPYRYGRACDRSDLSAGEKQLLATATLWAMRDVSRLPIPVFIDTPVARLDTDHREAMVESFLPRIGHQVVLLATDAEADALMSEGLEPLLARVYELRYDPASAATVAARVDPTSEDRCNLEMELVQ